MRSIVRTVLIASLAGLIVAQAQAAQSKETKPTLRGLVVDEAGRPVPKATVGRYASIRDGRLKLDEPVTTDAEGRFELAASGSPYPIVALGPEGRLGAVVPPPTSDSHVLRLKLEPLRPVRIMIEAPPIAYETDGSISVSLQRDTADASYWAPLVGVSFSRSLELQLPPGRYEVSVFNYATRIPKPVPFEVRAGGVAKVTVRLEPTKIVSLAGQPPPEWHVLAARGLSKDVGPKDFRGKWLLLDFWGFW